LSPEDLRREAEQVRQEIRPDGGGEPPVVVIEVAEELREDELASLLQAADEASRVVILCILGSVLAKGLGRRLSAPRPRDRSQRNDQTKLRTASSAGGMRARSHSATISRA
jgi:hypothetical protein